MTKECRNPNDEGRRPIPFELRASSFLRHSSFGHSSLNREISENDRNQKNLYERNFKKEDPAEPHQLVVTEAGERPAHPDKNKKKRGDLREKNKYVNQPPTPARRPVRDAGKVP